MEAVIKRLKPKARLFIFCNSVYAGIYITQNYDVPRVDEPSKLWEKVKEWTESHKKKDE